MRFAIVNWQQQENWMTMTWEKQATSVWERAKQQLWIGGGERQDEVFSWSLMPAVLLWQQVNSPAVTPVTLGQLTLITWNKRDEWDYPGRNIEPAMPVFRFRDDIMTLVWASLRWVMQKLFLPEILITTKENLHISQCRKTILAWGGFKQLRLESDSTETSESKAEVNKRFAKRHGLLFFFQKSIDTTGL